MKNIIVIHHDDPDGFGGAWAAWKKFKNKADYFPVDPETLPDFPIENKEVYIIDSSCSEAELNELIKNGNKVTIIDHHKSAESVAKKAHNFSFDIDHSGAVLAWKYFHGGKTIPKILKHIEDYDLWKFKLSGTKEIEAYLRCFELSFKLLDDVAKKIEKASSKKEIINTGKIILKYEQKIVDKIVKRADVVDFLGYKTLVTNFAILNDQICGAFVRKMPPMGIMWRERDGKKIFSLRSDGSVDVAKIAEKFGGGGHKGAAGFSLPADEKLPWKLLNR